VKEEERDELPDLTWTVNCQDSRDLTWKVKEEERSTPELVLKIDRDSYTASVPMSPTCSSPGGSISCPTETLPSQIFEDDDEEMEADTCETPQPPASPTTSDGSGVDTTSTELLTPPTSPLLWDHNHQNNNNNIINSNKSREFISSTTSLLPTNSKFTEPLMIKVTEVMPGLDELGDLADLLDIPEYNFTDVVTASAAAAATVGGKHFDFTSSDMMVDLLSLVGEEPLIQV